MSRTAILFLLFTLTFPSFSQDDLSYAEQLQAIENEMDSLSIFNLIDSLFKLEVMASSEFHIRAGFTSNVTSAGRDYSISQSGISGGIGYYDKSGLYGDLSGFWNSGVEPNYNPTILSVGYLGGDKKNQWNYSLDAERWFYNPNDSSQNPLFYSIGASAGYNFNWGFASLDYSFLFGEETAHRIIPSLSGNLTLGKWWIFDNISLYPSANMMIGNEDITTLRITSQQVGRQTANRITRINSFSELGQEQRRFLSFMIRRAANQGTITTEARNQLLFSLRNSSDLSGENRQALRQIVNEGIPIEEFVNSNEFGVLNYSFTFPLALSVNNFHILLSYTYSIPIQLSDEFIEVDPLGIFGASISYRIPFK
ncbi:MAG: hypothetical protein HRT61_17570 [Ekhidna sp.]|nr:hypothetical protein [Ekhidna sp.]